MPAHLIGCHMPTGGGLDKAIRRAKQIGCSAVQVFTSSPQQWRAKPVDPEAAAAFRQAVEETGMSSTVSHDSYLVNLAAPSDELREKSKAALVAEIGRCSAYGIPCVVSHIGAHMGQGEDAGLQRAAEAVIEVLAESPDDVTLVAETTAGQGTVLNSRFESLAKLIDWCRGHDRLGVCLDTCHVFAAGYDVSSPGGIGRTLDEFDRVVGIERLMVIHANDSKHPLGSRKDRHEHLGQGEIGTTCFFELVHDPRTERTPIIVETPDAETEHANNVAKLWTWAHVAV
ncbi:MAG: deoxyribonuclease IV [Fimbriimonadaceae bacterium]|nr:deoxyribonuclease IV [Fimbriimonadaceae bacterium]QYK57964.1 MAG: deoxyribonuclease IV [Fimbriimonadaceae bacterium]